MFENSHFHLGITFISITLFTYFIFYACNFILQIFEDLDRMCRNKLHMSGAQKMSKSKQQRKILAVREQINTLKLRVTKLESCLRTLQEDHDQYFQNSNTLMGPCPTHIVCVHYYQAIPLPEASKASVCCFGINKILYKECTRCLCESSGTDVLQLS